jgi:hypothetical protein
MLAPHWLRLAYHKQRNGSIGPCPTFLLLKGDSPQFGARLPHRWHNPGNELAIFLLVFRSAVTGESMEKHLDY